MRFETLVAAALASTAIAINIEISPDSMPKESKDNCGFYYDRAIIPQQGSVNTTDFGKNKVPHGRECTNIGADMNDHTFTFVIWYTCNECRTFT
jgi:hypothetical protein